MRVGRLAVGGRLRRSRAIRPATPMQCLDCLGHTCSPSRHGLESFEADGRAPIVASSAPAIRLPFSLDGGTGRTAAPRARIGGKSECEPACARVCNASPDETIVLTAVFGTTRTIEFVDQRRHSGIDADRRSDTRGTQHPVSPSLHPTELIYRVRRIIACRPPHSADSRDRFVSDCNDRCLRKPTHSQHNSISRSTRSLSEPICGNH